jgi:hypothetical protein
MGESAAELRRDIEETRLHMTSTVDAIEDRVVPGRILERRRNRMRSSLSSMRDRVMGAPHQVGSSLSSGISSGGATMQQDASNMAHRVEAKTEGSPFAAGFMAFGAGMLVAALIPPSGAEQQLAAKAREAAEPLKEPLSEAAHDLADRAKEHGSDAMAAVKEAGSSAGQSVTETAKEKAQEARQAAQHSGAPST